MNSHLSEKQAGQSLDNTSESDSTCYRHLPLRQVRGLSRRELTPKIIARFSQKYKQSRGCWLWLTGKFAKGYGMFNLWRDEHGKQRTEYAHRIAYVLAHGDIPPGAVVMHACDTPACVNPAHLSLGTQKDNVRDAAQKGHYSVPRPSLQKLTSGDVAAIRMSLAKGLDLARAYQVTPSLISLIRRGRRRKAA